MVRGRRTNNTQPQQDDRDIELNELRQHVQQLQRRIMLVESNQNQDRRMRHGSSKSKSCEDRDRRMRHDSSTSTIADQNQDRRMRHGSSRSKTCKSQDRRK
jgi:septum formation inhibitor MinC